MFKVLREPRWIALILAVPVGVVLCLMLSDWQWNRYEGRKDANTVLGNNIERPVVPAEKLLGNVGGVDESTQWRSVTATGRYNESAQVLVRKRPLNNANGFWVVTPLVISGNKVIVVNRGWIKADSDARSTPVVPPPPTGTVTVTGRVQPSTSDAARASDVPAGQVNALNVDSIGATSGSKVLPAYLDLTSSEPPQQTGLTPIPLPEIDEGRHLSYSMQWIAFAILFIVGLILLLRREMRLRREEPGQTSGEPATPPGESVRLPQDSSPR